MTREYLIQDPHHEYAVRFIEHLYRKYGYRAVCYYTDRRERLRQERAFPQLRSDRVAASYDVPLERLEDFARHLRAHHDIAGVIPFNEPAVLPGAKLARLLDFDYAHTHVLARFRDKFAFKEHLRNTAKVRMNGSERVATLPDILTARESGLSKFVLKPNDGYGNREIGFFDERSTPAEIEHYLRVASHRPLVMEEFIGGQEYFVNGQVDARGNVTIVAAFAYRRAPANGHPQIDHETSKVPHASELFATLANYTQAVVNASGLQRSPFHLELKIDEQGPCLIEVGARFPGLKNAFVCERLHGSLDLFDVAAHYYLFATDYGPIPLDWNAYDSRAIRYVHGIAPQARRIYDVGGNRKVEQLPQFVEWVKRPALGERPAITRDCLSMPWAVVLGAASENELDSAAQDVRRLLEPSADVSAYYRAVVNARVLTTKIVRGVEVRVKDAMSKGDGFTTDATRRGQPRLLMQLAKLLDKGVRRAQLLGLGARTIDTPLTPVTPKQALAVQAAYQWGEEFLGRPHADLGRKGAICPFIKQTMALGQFFVSVHAGIDGRSLRKLRRIVLDEVARYDRLCPMNNRKAAFSGLVIVLPDCDSNSFRQLDEVHSQLKTHLMRHDVMFSAFHPNSRKPSIANPEFHPFRAPFAALVIRRVDVRDIAFLGHNRGAFERYYERFAPLFRDQQVSNEFDHVRLFEAACARFGFTEGVRS